MALRPALPGAGRAGGQLRHSQMGLCAKTPCVHVPCRLHCFVLVQALHSCSLCLISCEPDVLTDVAASCRERGRSGSTAGGLGGAGGGGESELQLQRRRLRDRQKTLRAQLGEVRPAMPSP